MIGLCGALCVAFFALDLLVPLGVAGGVPYIAPVLISYRTDRRRYILIVAAVCSALTLLGYLLSPAGGEPWMVLSNRGLALAAIWITAFLAYDRRRSEDALRRNESRLANAQRIANLGSWEWDPDLGSSRWSDGVFSIFGLEPGQVPPRFDELLKIVHEEDREALLDNLRQGMLDPTRLHYAKEFRIVRPDGAVRFIASQGEFIRDTSGKVLRLVGVSQDITERKREEQRRHRAEDRLNDAVESIADGFVLFDVEDRVVLWNQRFADMYPELGALLPTRPTAEDMFRERHRVGAVGAFDVPAEQYVKWRMEMRRKQGGTPAVHRHSDGRWYRTTERPTTEGGIVAISTDVTELKSRELDLLEAMEQTELANRAKSDFLANMSHELRTPLNAVIGFSEMISAEMFGPIGHPRYKEYAEDIRASGAHLLGIVSELLDLSKIEAGKSEIEERDLNAADVVDSAVRLVTDRATAAAVELSSHVSDRLPGLRADERAVKQILLNLLSNAIKFTPAGGKVTTSIELDAERRFVLSVADTGIGIAEKDIGQVMAPFGQIETALTRSHEGSGLGLPLVEGLVGLHGGTFELESEVGVGTTATVRFPAGRTVDAAPDRSVREGVADEDGVVALGAGGE
jgi:two-component system cell cycle sensor histidine kinase PleC